MNILYLEPYSGGSHRAFMEGFCAHSRHEVSCVSLSDISWKWRMSGGAVSLAEQTKQVEGYVDLILASSMTNLPAFIALTNPRFAHTPCVMYMHENQLTMPLPEGEQRDETYCYINYLSALVADELWFSSRFHLQEFFEALPVFLKKYSDRSYLRLIDQLQAKSRVVHPGIALQHFDAQRRPAPPASADARKPPVIVWNQRWEYDRNPDMFCRIINRLDDTDCVFDLILAGDQLHTDSPELRNLRDRYGDRILHYGYVTDMQKYGELLHKGDIALSTSRYEFFCTALMEAVYCGCHPMVPNDLTYPELIPEALQQPLLHAPVFYESEDDLFRKMRRLLLGEVRPLPPATLRRINKHLDWNQHINVLDDLLEGVVQKSG
jgi:glycosyltransferase involved in cell wall biosynthesis